MFRYERPQMGRQRQFHQIGIESLGSGQPSSDVNAIAFAWHLLTTCGLQNELTLEINTIGDAESRNAHRQLLYEHFEKHLNSLSPLSRERFARGALLRILDSKEPEDQEILKSAPSLHQNLTRAARERFESVLSQLSAINIPFVVNERLVRGLDYYSHTCFEITTKKLGAQAAVLAGGRYDDLATQLGSPQPIPAFGWAAGLERLVALLPPDDEVMDQLRHQRRAIAVIPIAERSSDQLSDEDRATNAEIRSLALNIVQSLRANEIPATFIDSEDVDTLGPFTYSLKKQLSAANKLGCKAALLFGTKEVQEGRFILRDLDSHEQVFGQFETEEIVAKCRSVLASRRKAKPLEERGARY